MLELKNPIKNSGKMQSMYIKVHAMPGVKKEVCKRRADDLFDIAVREPAKNNSANIRIREILAQELGVPPGKVRLVTGAHSMRKIYNVDDINK